MDDVGHGHPDTPVSPCPLFSYNPVKWIRTKSVPQCGLSVCYAEDRLVWLSPLQTVVSSPFMKIDGVNLCGGRKKIQYIYCRAKVKTLKGTFAIIVNESG